MSWIISFFIIYYGCLCYCSYTTTIKRCAKAGINNNQQYHNFLKFISKYNKNYKTPRECKIRFKIFKKTLKSISNIEEGYNGVAKYGITFGADFTKRDWRRRTGYIATEPIQEAYYQSAPIEIPVSWDWRKKGIVGPPSNQRRCSGCFAFAAAGVAEMMYTKKIGKAVRISEQQLLDCDHATNRCAGGDFVSSFEYLARSGAMLQSDYPFVEKNQSCVYDLNKTVFRAKKVVILPNDEKAMAQFVYEHGPLVAGLSAETMQIYEKGILLHEHKLCQSTPSHAIVLVGYGVKTFPDGTNIPFWIGRNSWGDTWGEKGFFRIARGYNLCNITVHPVSVEI